MGTVREVPVAPRKLLHPGDGGAAGPLPGPPIATSDNGVDVRAGDLNSIGFPAPSHTSSAGAVPSKTYRSNDPSREMSLHRGFRAFGLQAGRGTKRSAALYRAERRSRFVELPGALLMPYLGRGASLNQHPGRADGMCRLGID
jgi:hypothetical protein